MNYTRGMFGIWYNPVQIYAGARIMPSNRAYSSIFDNFRNSDRGYFHNKCLYRGHFYRGSKRRLSKGNFQKLSHLSSCDKLNKGEDSSQKVETLSTESKETEQDKQVSLENKTYPPKGEVKPGSEGVDSDKQLCSALTVPLSPPGIPESLLPCRGQNEFDLNQPELKDNEAAEDSSNQTPSMPSAEVFTEELSETTEGHRTMEKQQPMLSQADQDFPKEMASFPSASVPAAEHSLSETTEKLLCVEENDSPLTKITGYHENSDHEQGSCGSTVNSINHQQILSNIRCVPVLVRNTSNKLNQSKKTSDNLRGWAPEDCQDPPCSMNYRIASMTKSRDTTGYWRESSHKRAHYCYPHCRHNCRYSQKITWDLLPHFSGKIKGHRSPQVKRKISKVSHHPPESTAVKKNETELKKPTKKKKTILEKRMTSTKLEKQTTQGQGSASRDETSTLPEASQDLLPVLPPVRTEETEQVQMEVKNENTASPCQTSAGEKNSSSTMPWTPKDRSEAVLARKEAIEEAYLQVLLNFAGVATMLVEKAPCMQEAMDSALRANLRRIGDYYGCMLTSYIDSLAEAS